MVDNIETQNKLNFLAVLATICIFGGSILLTHIGTIQTIQSSNITRNNLNASILGFKEPYVSASIITDVYLIGVMLFFLNLILILLAYNSKKDTFNGKLNLMCYLTLIMVGIFVSIVIGYTNLGPIFI